MVDRPPTVLLTGATGFLGVRLLDALRARSVRVVCGLRGAAPRTAGSDRTRRVELDLEDAASIRAALAAVRPDVVLNAGAASSIAACERDPRRAMAINADAPRLLAEQARVVQVSTDLVFDGTEAPYGPEARPRPRNAYGRSKAAGEDAVSAAAGLVVRLPLLFGPSPDGRRGATDMIRSASPGGGLVLFTNEFRTPVHVADAARALVDLLSEGGRSGFVHLRGPERVSRYDLGLRFARLADIRADRFRPGECTDPSRPRDVSLEGDTIGPDLDSALRRC